ncbi:hypothetical protein CTAYLR_001497 [Chrysophaeum taylorii]|uniref:Polycystin cation channel PKD1/PKD2 domain-containing protein n=1 Tax=Chrysophaeum taylorii TaxID=2483200 RepID=A0AAD7UDK9_9STRA|nr:hypothetical protein CTAYLR_001497 [Chrysophaeum taylorii]
MTTSIRDVTMPVPEEAQTPRSREDSTRRSRVGAISMNVDRIPDTTRSTKFQDIVKQRIQPTVAERVYARAVSVKEYNDHDRAAVAYVVLDQMGAYVTYTLVLKHAYRALGKFLAYVTLVLLIVCWQHRFFSSGVEAYTSMKNTLFALSEGVASDGTEINDRLSSLDAFLTFVNETVLSTVFIEPTCGDNVCESPEEHPKFRAADDARTFRGSCQTDCGTAVTKTVTIDFFDTSKLQEAFRTVKKALESGFMGSPATSWGVVDADGNVLRPPAAGYNVCSRTDRELGFFTTACVFDGDIFIDDLPYRTAELDPDSVSFSGSKTIELYEGTWELRIAFANFTWPKVDDGSGAEVPIAFPAVRGRVCTTDENGTTCETWAPCPSTLDCKCMWYLGGHYCFDDDPSTLPDWSGWQDDFEDYPRLLGLEYTAKYMLRNAEDVELLLPNASAAFGTRDDDAWLPFDVDRCPQPYVLYLLDSWGDGWDDGELTITTIKDGDVSYRGSFNEEDSSYFDVESNFFIKEVHLDLCPSNAYYLQVTASDFASEQSWILEEADGTVVVDGYDPPVTCVIFGNARDDDIPACTGGDDDGGRRRLSTTRPEAKENDAGGVRLLEEEHAFGDDDDDAGSPPWPASSYEYEHDTRTAAPSATLSTSRTPTAATTTYTNAWGLPASALMPCSRVDPSASTDRKCSELEYDYRATECVVRDAQDAMCHAVNNNLQCGWDGGDCCEASCEDTELRRCGNDDDDGGGDGEWSECKAPEMAAQDWPFVIELYGGDTRTRVPYVFARSVLDLVEAWARYDWDPATEQPVAKKKDDVVTVAAVPSLACGDCAAYPEGDSYMSIPFEVRTATRNPNAMFPTRGNETRARYFGEPNRVLGGPLLTQLRFQSRECPKAPFRSSDDVAQCFKFPEAVGVKAYTLATPFGRDATYLDTSALYREDHDDDETAYYDPVSEVENGIPYGFFADAGSGAGSKIVRCPRLGVSDAIDVNDAAACLRYPVLFANEWNVSRVREVVQLLADGRFYDRHTAVAVLHLALYNPETRTFFYIQARATRLATGQFEFDWKIKSVEAEPYATTLDNARLGFEVLFATALVALIAIEVREALATKRLTGSFWPYVSALSNVIDLTNYCLAILCVALYARFLAVAAETRRAARYGFDVYREFYARRRILQMKRREAIDMTRFFRRLNKLATLKGTYETTIGLFLILVCLQLVKNLAFHPVLGLISHTMYYAANDLAFFVILLLIINSIYAFLGTLLFGSYVEAFSSFHLALSSSVSILSGAYMPLDDTGKTVIALVYFWSHTAINFFLLLNFLLAIIVDSYQKAKADVETNPLYDFNRDPIFDVFRDLIGRPLAGGCHVPDRILLDHINDAKRRLEPRMADLLSSTSARPRRRPSFVDKVAVANAVAHAQGAESTHFLILEPRPGHFRAFDQHLVELAFETPGRDDDDDDDDDAGPHEGVIAKILSFNMLQRYGHNADTNRDGVLDDAELRALRDLIHIEDTADRKDLLIRAFVALQAPPPPASLPMRQHRNTLSRTTAGGRHSRHFM